ncbi:ArsR/SmtB family transcription factor [Rothia uropygioeca]|uniref:ArsR/SmtB family transcription factor n=1 Tax=Kocuria sp. 257 TaxID=2021970 RepID=UPI0010106234|nr:metalloregulator ArsR/SmtB family transcription factor [Kocuria sp. 257]
MSNDVFAVVADPTRRRILTVVKNGPHPVNDVVTELGVSQPTVSKHLKVLREAGLVTMKAQGQRRLYSLNPEPLRDLREWTEELVAEEGDAVGPETGAPAEEENSNEATESTAESASTEDPGVQAQENVSAGVSERRDLGPERTSSQATPAEPDTVDAHEATRPAVVRKRHGVVFTPLAPLSASAQPAGGDDVEEFTSDLTPAVINHETEKTTAELPGGEPSSEKETEGSTQSTSWEPLDPEVRRTKGVSGAQHVAAENKQSGFLANLFARKRGR